MAQELLVNEQIDAGANFLRDFDDYVPIGTAVWINPAESDEWYLYVASDEIDDTNIDIAYGEVMRRTAQHKSPWLNPFRIKLVNSSDPVAREATEIRDRYAAAKDATHYNASSIGGLGIGGAYIYPPISTLKSVAKC